MKGQTCHHHVLGVNKKAFLKNLNTVSGFTVWFKPPDFWLTDGPSLLLYFLTNDSPHGFRNLGRCNIRGVTNEHERHGFGGYGRCEFIQMKWVTKDDERGVFGGFALRWRRLA